MRTPIRTLVTTATVVLLVQLLAGTVPAADFLVDTTADVHDAAPGTGGCATATGACSLRAAIEEANALGGLHLITLPAGYYQLTLGGLYVTSNIAIDGAGIFFGSTIDANNATQVFFVEETGELNLTSMLLINGFDTSMFYGGGCIYSEGPLYLVGVAMQNCHTVNSGGAVWASDLLAMTDCSLLTNTAADSGGGIALSNHWGMLERVFLYQNVAGGLGGGLALDNVPAMYLTDCTIQQNEADHGGGISATTSSLDLSGTQVLGNTLANPTVSGVGGGILASDSSVILTTSTLSGNTALRGGGIHISATTSTISTLENVTVAGNTATNEGGGIALDGDVTLGLKNVTIAHNTATSGSAGAVFGYGSPTPDVELVNTLIAANGPVQCGGVTTASIGYNLEPPGSFCLPANPTDVHATPDLGALADNGGPTWTVALLPGSRGIDEGGDAFAPTADQRGVPRFDGDSDGSIASDIGAYEYDVLFGDGFESGDTAAWSGEVG